MYTEEELIEALRISNSVSLGLYPDGQPIIDDIESLKNKRLRGNVVEVVIKIVQLKQILCN